MARKRVVFVIVEGPSEDTALGVLLSKIYDANAVYVHIWHGDITSDSSVNPGNIISKLGKVVTKYAEDNHYKKEHFQEIIHIIDTDGTYIPDENIVEDATAQELVYSETEIRTNNRKEAILRNERKRNNIDKLCGCKSVWSVPYGVYYMSSNLDHVLYGKMNSTDEEKEQDAYKFAKEYKDNVPGFLTYISESEFSVNMDYNESWNFIRQGLHSLERHTNLGLGLGGKEEAKA